MGMASSQIVSIFFFFGLVLSFFVGTAVSTRARLERIPPSSVRSVRSPLPYNDPLFEESWHLHSLNMEEHPSFDLLNTWARGVNGSGVSISVVDQYIDVTHPEIASKLTSDSDPFSAVLNLGSWSQANRGTIMASLAAGLANNGVCGIGVAPASPLNAFYVPIGSTDEQEALVFKKMTSSSLPTVYVSDIGPNDNGFSVSGPGPLTEQSFAEGVFKGRDGRGIVYVWAAGDGRQNGDNCNFDGYSNSIYTLTVGSVSYDGVVAPYSEECPSQIAVAPSK